MSDPALLDQLVAAIVRQEHGEKKVYPNNNPGNIWDGLCTGKLKRIWPHIPIDRLGFLRLKDTQEGIAFMREQIRLKIQRGLTLRQLIGEWAPARGEIIGGHNFANDTRVYTDRIAAHLGLDPNVKLRDRRSTR